MGAPFQSWGRYPQFEQQGTALQWRDLPLPLELAEERSLLPFGNGRSYGDCCLNEDNLLLATHHLNHLIEFDRENGVVRCEAGITLGELLAVIVPAGWFLPVTPGTQFVTVGGAIANDVHGKNHHLAGTFGCHLRALELLRSSGKRLFCSANKHHELFNATIGGLGLTGLISWAEIQLKPINNPLIHSETIRFTNIEEFVSLCQESDQSFEYTVAWLDCQAKGENLGRGLFMRGNHTSPEYNNQPLNPPKLRPSIPFNAPSFSMHPIFIKGFNQFYYHRQRQQRVESVSHYAPFFYPLDAIGNWNRLYGKRGFLQYQCVVPYQDGDLAPIKSVLKLITEQGQGSFLAVLKLFGEISSPGMLSFPRPGLSLALDFPNRGEKLLKLFAQLDHLVLQHNGALYPAKDAAMHATSFKQFYPEWQAFSKFIDPKFSSSLWRRVSGIQTR